MTQSNTNLCPPDIQFLAPVCLHFLFAQWSSISGVLPLCALFEARQRQKTVVSHCSSALFIKNTCPPCHHVIFLKIWDPLLFLLILLLCSLFILSQTSIYLSRSRSSRGGPGCEVSHGRCSVIEVSSIYVAVRASERALIAASKLATIAVGVQDTACIFS